MKLEFSEDDLKEPEFEKSEKVSMDDLSHDEDKRFIIAGTAESDYGTMLLLEGGKYVGIKEATLKRLARAYGMDTDNWKGKPVDICLHTYKIGKSKKPTEGRLVKPVKPVKDIEEVAPRVTAKTVEDAFELSDDSHEDGLPF